MAKNQQDFERLLAVVGRLVAKCLTIPSPDLREEILELYDILLRIGYNMDAAMHEAQSQFQQEFLPPREFFTVVCDQVEAALDRLRTQSKIPDHVVDGIYDCVIKGDLTTLMTGPALLEVLLAAMSFGDRTAWEAEWFFQFVIGMNVYRLALKEGPIPVLEKAEEAIVKGKEEKKEERKEKQNGAKEWEFGDPLIFGENDSLL